MDSSHRHRRATHRFLTCGDQRAVTLKLGLVNGDLSGQMGPGFRQPVRPVRNTARHRLTLPRAFQSPERTGLTFLAGARRALVLGPQLARGLPDPVASASRLAQLRRQSVGSLLTTGRPRGGVLSVIDLFGVGDSLGSVPVEPFSTTIRIDRRIRPDFRSIDRQRAEPGQPGPRGNHQHLR